MESTRVINKKIIYYGFKLKLTFHQKNLIVTLKVSINHVYDVGPNNIRVTSKDRAQTLMKNLGLEVAIQFEEGENIILDS